MFQKLLDAIQSDVLPPAPKEFHPGDVMPFHLYEVDGFPKERGAAAITIDQEFLHVYGLFQDKTPLNKTFADNQTTWSLGDAFEFFFQEPGHEDYYEWHSTPQGYRLQLHLPSYLTFRNYLHTEKVCDCGLIVRNKIDKANALWYSELFIPLNNFASVDGAKLAFCRYDYNWDQPEPELSSCPLLSHGFHMPPEWLILKTN